jgi:transposase
MPFYADTEVAKHLGLDWKTVKNIDKFYLEGQYGQPNLNRLRILAVDEISIRKGHRYLTVVLDYLCGRVVFVGKHRKEKALDHWCSLASSINHRSVNTFVKVLERYRYGILNHCQYPIQTGKLEGVNNKIKVIKRKAYGYHDLRYFTLKIYQAFYN